MRALIVWDGPPDTFREWIKLCTAARLPVICWLNDILPLPLPAVCEGVECVISRRPTPEELHRHNLAFSTPYRTVYVLPYVFETPYFFTDEELFSEGLGKPKETDEPTRIAEPEFIKAV